MGPFCTPDKSGRGGKRRKRGGDKVWTDSYGLSLSRIKMDPIE